MNKNEPFNFQTSVKILGGLATVTINETHKVLSEKSLYGAGSTRIDTTVTVTFKHYLGHNELEVLRRHTFEKQDVIDIDRVNSMPVLQQNGEAVLMCKRLAKKAIVNYMFELAEENEQLQKQINAY